MKKVVFFLLVFFLTTSNVYALNKYKVTFVIDSYKNVVEVEENNTVTPPEPVKDGYTLVGFTNNGVMFDFNTPITSNMTLTAIWQKQEEVVTEEPEVIAPTPSDTGSNKIDDDSPKSYSDLSDQAKYVLIGIPVVLVIIFKYMLIPTLKAKKANKENKN